MAKMQLKMVSKLNRFAREERGTQLVELAIILPIFLIMFASVAEFGRFFYAYTTLSKAARTGTRYLITAKNSPQADATAKNLVVYGNPAGTGTPVVKGLTPAHVIITRTGGTSAVPEEVTVKISGFQYQPAFDLGKMIKVPSLSFNFDIKPSVTMHYLITQPLL